MSFNDYDKSSKPLVDSVDLEQAKFIKNVLDHIEIRVGNDPEAPLFIGAGNKTSVPFSGTTDAVIGDPTEIKATPLKDIDTFIINNEAPIEDPDHNPVFNIDSELHVSIDDGTTYLTLFAGGSFTFSLGAVNKIKIKSNVASLPFSAIVNFKEF